MRGFPVISVLFLLSLFCSCSGHDEIDRTPATLSLQPSSVELFTGETARLEAIISPPDAALSSAIVWTSSDSGIVSVASGFLRALAEGNAVVTASVSGMSATCSVSVKESFIEVVSVTMDRDSLFLYEGEEALLNATVFPPEATDPSVIWSSSDTAVVAVAADGRITAGHAGVATVTAGAGGEIDTCTVTVEKRIVPVESVTLDRETLEMNKGDHAVLTATVIPEDATDAAVSWVSTDETVVSVDDAGKLTALSGGHVAIIATAGEASARCEVTVTVPVSAILLEPDSLVLQEGGRAVLTATVLPEDATEKTITWATSDPSVVTVSEKGEVNVVGAGIASITVSCGGKTAICSVVVEKQEVIPVSVFLDCHEISLVAGESALLHARITPSDSSETAVSWRSSDPEVAEVEDGRITALRKGETLVSATAGTHADTCKVVVLERIVPVEEISLNVTSLSLVKGKSATLNATVMPSDATDKHVSWSSSAPSVVSVDASGKVTALAGGEADIFATAEEKEAVCHVTVTVPVKSLNLDKTNLTVYAGGEGIIHAYISPADATDTTVTWTCSDTTVATVSYGRVKGLKTGYVTIKAAAGGFSARCQVHVARSLAPVEELVLNKTELALDEGQTCVLEATVSPVAAAGQKVYWATSDKTVVSVEEDGTVTAHRVGEADITATAGNKSAICHVTVSVPLTGLRLNISSLDLYVGVSATLQAIPVPEHVQVTVSPTWTSSSSSVVQVSKDGVVTALSAGTAVVTASWGGYRASCKVTCENRTDRPDASAARTFDTGDKESSEDNISTQTFDRTVYITYTSSGAQVEGDASRSVTVNGNDVTVRYDGPDLVVYELSGTASDGRFKLYGSRKQAICLNGLDLTCRTGAPINIQNRKRTYVHVVKTNSLADGTVYSGTPSGEDEKAAFFSEGQLIFSGRGTLNIVSRGKNGLVSDEYIRIMSSPTVVVSSSSGHAVKGKDAIIVSNGCLEAMTSADTKKAVSADSLVWISGGSVKAIATGSAAYIEAEGDKKGVAAVKADRLFRIDGGTLTAKATGLGSKAIAGDGSAIFRGGTVNVTATGAHEKTTSTRAAGIKFWQDVSLEGSRVNVYCTRGEGIVSKGTLTVSAGVVQSVSEFEDAFNSSGDMTLSGGRVAGIGYNADGFDSNRNLFIKGGLVYALGFYKPEHALDANLERGYGLYLQGGTVIASAELHEGYTTNMPILQGTFTAGKSYALLENGKPILTIRTPSGADSRVSELNIYLGNYSSSSQYSLLSGVTFSGGTGYFDGFYLEGASVSGGRAGLLNIIEP